MNGLTLMGGWLVIAFLGGEYRVGKLEKYRICLRLPEGEMGHKIGNGFGKDLTVTLRDWALKRA